MLTNAEYHAHPAIGSTTAKTALISRQLYLDTVAGLNKVDETPAMRLGTLCHTLVLEPETVAEKWVSHGPINPRTQQPYGIGTKAHDEWLAENPDAVIVPESVRIMLQRMPPQIADIFKEPAQCEHSFFADIGVEAKARPDHLTDTWLTDLKTINDMDKIEQVIGARNYPFSMEWYCRVVGPRKRRWIFAETNPPYRWRIVFPDWEWVDIAKSDVDSAIETITTPCADDDVELIVSPPAWRM